MKEQTMIEQRLNRRLDLTGQRFGRWTAKQGVTINGKTRWLCVCDCGNERDVSLTNLRSGKSQSCGCLHQEVRSSLALDLTGQRFGSLLVMGLNEERTVRGRGGKLMWNCACDCGGTSVVQTNNLRSGNTQTCRDRSKHMLIEEGDIRLYHKRYEAYRRRSKERGQGFDLTIEEFAEICSEPCHYCGVEHDYAVIKKKGGIPARGKMNGIDRKDSDVGYVKGNCLPCCGRCNEMKNDASYAKFKEDIRRIYKNMNME